jgi:hypothetical protein
MTYKETLLLQREYRQTALEVADWMSLSPHAAYLLM